MKILLLFLILCSLFTFVQTPVPTNETAPMNVSSFKWSRARQTVETHQAEVLVPERAVIAQNKTFARNARINEPRGARDPNQDTLDGRSAAMEKSVQESRAPKSEPRDGYAYRIKVKNGAQKVAEIIFWEYQFYDTTQPELVARRQFLCGVSIGPDKGKELEGFSLSGPSDVVSVAALADKSRFKENVLINRIEYSDGSMWQRNGWNLRDVKASYDRVLREQWQPGQCKGL
ncbi:MAG TPA: hypothetical protein VJS17_01190 [Pyrinomonadaceae bacterium]|nr:hypothetical protein [Pyrinomonadaceae bacterium]